MSIVPFYLMTNKACLCKFLKIKYMVPVQMCEQYNIHIRRLAADLSKAGFNVINSRPLHGRAVMILIGMFRPGHTRVNQNQLVSTFN